MLRRDRNTGPLLEPDKMKTQYNMSSSGVGLSEDVQPKVLSSSLSKPLDFR